MAALVASDVTSPVMTMVGEGPGQDSRRVRAAIRVAAGSMSTAMHWVVRGVAMRVRRACGPHPTSSTGVVVLITWVMAVWYMWLRCVSRVMEVWPSPWKEAARVAVVSGLCPGRGAW